MKPFVATGMTDERMIAERILDLVDSRFPGTFSSRWIARAYCETYEEINTRKVTAVLEDLADAGFLVKVEAPRKRNRPNHYRHGAGMRISKDMTRTIGSGQAEHI